jgi:hypothetical protein
MLGDDSTVWDDSGLRDGLEAFAREDEAAGSLLPWSDRLDPEGRVQLRADLALVLSEPALTGEPLDWREIREILREWAEAAGWEGALVQCGGLPPDGPYAIDLRPRDTDALAAASAAVQAAVNSLLAEFLPAHPTAIRLLPRGHLKKLKNRDIWQIELPDGYRLRYYVDKLERTVHVTYLGPHPDRDPRGREQSVRSRVQRERHEGE